MTQLLHRNTAGIEVEIVALRNEPLAILLAVGVNGESASATIPADRVLDAFEHPFVYLSDSDVETLFPTGA